MIGTTRRRLPLAFVALASVAACGSAAPTVPAPLALERTIALPHVSGRIDHLAIDLKHNRLFVAEVGKGSVDMIDLTRGVVTGRIDGLKEPQGVAWLPARDELAVASGGDGTVRVYRGGDLAPVGVMAFGVDADNLRVDLRNGLLVVGYGSGALAVIDPATRTVLTRVSLPGHPEGFRLFGDKAIVSVPDARRIIIANLATGAIEANWRATYRMGFPMAVDQGAAALIYRWPARLVVMDTATGAVTSDLPTCGDSDDVFFDPPRHRIMVSCGSGAVEVVGASSGGYRSLGSLSTRSGARTALFVPALNRLFVAMRAGSGEGAEIRVYRPTR